MMNIDQALGLIRSIPDYPKTGVVFKDITPMLQSGEALACVIQTLSTTAGASDVVAAIEARGFILGAGLAVHRGCGFVPLRKKGKLPHTTHARSYGLEYGVDELEIHADAFISDSRVLLLDDVLATGGTIIAGIELVKAAGGAIDEVIVLLEIGFLNGRAKIAARFPEITITALALI